jgi:O-antigen biosynthesis protein
MDNQVNLDHDNPDLRQSQEKIVPDEPIRTDDTVALFKRVHMKLRHRACQLRSTWANGGARGITESIRKAVAERLAPTVPALPVRPADVLACDISLSRSWPLLSFNEKQPLTINWITTPPARGSGGHTTMFRLIESLIQCGHKCRVYIYDVNGGDANYQAANVRDIFPRFYGEVNDASAGMADAHAVIATAWQTAYPAYNDCCSGKRFYLVQDYEPWFYPVGDLSTLAENTYRMGFHAITAGRFLAEKLRTEYGMMADAFDFGCDTNKYHLIENGGRRDGVAFYVRPGTPRRAFELGLLALRLLVGRHPNLTIHLYGTRIGKLPFSCVDHGIVSPNDLNRIYNRCLSGLCLSMTNVSLVPYEMLAAGCIPVMNEAEHNRIVLDNPFVRYAPPTPHALARELEEVVMNTDFASLAASASASVSSVSWEAAGSAVERSIRRALAK